MPRMIDLNHVISAGQTTYPGMPGPVIDDYLSRAASRGTYAPGVEFQIGRIEMIANTGTYLDTPFHRYSGENDIAGVDLASCADLPGVVIDARETRAVGVEVLATQLDRRWPDGLAGMAVLIRTGWDRHFGTPAYGESAPFLTRAAVEWLTARGPALVGIDSVNIDDPQDGARPAHSELLGAGILIVEHLTALDRLPTDGFRFFAVPPRIVGMGSFPVRSFAIADD